MSLLKILNSPQKLKIKNYESPYKKIKSINVKFCFKNKTAAFHFLIKT